MEEKIKKTSTPRKPHKTAAKAIAAHETAPTKRTVKAKVTEMKASPEQIAQLAHQFWIERGGEHGHDAEDWLRAEQLLRGKAS